MSSDKTIAIVGLGYVGLPLLHAFSQCYATIGFDTDESRIEQLKGGVDKTGELSKQEMQELSADAFTADETALSAADVFIITVPSPVDSANIPDLSALISASETVATFLTPGNVVIYESTVYPGATREVCVPILEARSSLRLNSGFFVGYSPERINPGDRNNKFKQIVKVTSGSDSWSAGFVNELYARVVDSTYGAPSIEVAEAAKVIENIQRDVNIALMNEFSLIFQQLGIETKEVLKAAGTKWNFLKFEPGLVGGHCIGVDPYYLTHKAQQVGYLPELILAGRNLNERFVKELVRRFMKEYVRRGLGASNEKRILMLGITFKEDCPDVRNTKVTALIDEFMDLGFKVDVFDPVADTDGLEEKYRALCISELEPDCYAGIVIAVKHDYLRAFSLSDLMSISTEKPIVYDIKSMLPSSLDILGI